MKTFASQYYRGLVATLAATCSMLAACSSADRSVTGLVPVTMMARNTSDPLPPAELQACKWIGPAGTYTFAVAVNGGGDYALPAGTSASVEFNGYTPACKTVYVPTANESWSEGEKAEVTVTEIGVPTGSVLQIMIWEEGYGFYPSVFGSSSVTLSIGLTNSTMKVKFVNGDAPPPPSANCYSINALSGVAIAPVQLEGTGGAGGPYTFSATGLPAGLTLSSSGVLSGTPTVEGTFSYTVTVTDKDGNVGSGGTCSVKVTPGFAAETAVGAGYRYPNTSNWFMYSPYKTTKIDLIAGQHYDAGNIYMSRTSTATIIRIELQNGFTWANVPENLKINPYATAPTAWVQPGAFAYKFTVSGSIVTVTIPGTNAEFYGIHGDVMRPLQ